MELKSTEHRGRAHNRCYGVVYGMGRYVKMASYTDAQCRSLLVAAREYSRSSPYICSSISAHPLRPGKAFATCHHEMQKGQ
jgi:hypothetical protein